MKPLKMIPLFIVLTCAVVILINCRSKSPNPKIKLGIDVLMSEQLDLIKSKRVGVITNQTGVDAQGNHIIDLLHQSSGVELAALFGPEHGIRGDIEGGYEIKSKVDSKTGVPIISIYGKIKKPTPEMLENIDVIIFDIQDVGTRFYTYISTMSLAMEAAAENNILFIVLDRPNPITGSIVEGPVLERKYESFVGIHPIALRHGMTVGELAMMFNNEGWLKNGVKVDLTVIEMQNWDRQSWYGELRLNWIKPSPNMPSPHTALLYPGMGLLETCNVSEGRGTKIPFENIGAPWLDYVALKERLENENIVGIDIDTTSYIPVDMPGAAMNPAFEGENCNGLVLTVSDPHTFLSVKFGVHLIHHIHQLHPDQFKWKSARSPLIMFGNQETPEAIMAGVPPDKIIQNWEQNLNSFLAIREKYLLYE